MQSTHSPSSPTAWRALSQSIVRGFHSYANWLVGISWKRFALLAVLLMMASALLQSLPPFNWRVTETVSEPARPPKVKLDKPGDDGKLDISIDDNGVRIVSRPAAAASSASAAAPAASAASAVGASIDIRLPADMSAETREAVREAVREARAAIQEALDEHAGELSADDGGATLPQLVQRTRRVRWGYFLTDLALLWVVGSIIIKITYKGRMQAEAKAAVATETAEAESLKRQVVEARMAAMQAQVEPHFLFNTLASIDHLIETDAARASQMQKNLIALLRASMPSLRETQAGGVRELGRELAMVRPYLEILKVRMEERMNMQIDVPDGLLSAEFPPMMLQSLVENAIKHGLEPKPEGGSLTLRAQIVHGKLAMSVADTGLGFGKAGTAGTGVGLNNIRERLGLLYGNRAALTIAENPGGGTVATITVPYRSLESADHA
jgi:signal transduction histidine kinase